MTLRVIGTRSVPGGITTRSVGTIKIIHFSRHLHSSL
jgi:hypothetical protein